MSLQTVRQLYEDLEKITGRAGSSAAPVGGAVASLFNANLAAARREFPRFVELARLPEATPNVTYGELLRRTNRLKAMLG